MFVAALGILLMVSAPVSAKDEVSLYFFMHSLYQRARGDPAKARRYLQRTSFQDAEIVKLTNVSPHFAFTYRDRSARSASLHPMISEELRNQLGSALYLKVLEYCRRSVQPQMRSVPPP
jgi:hypothetical protein